MAFGWLRHKITLNNAGFVKSKPTNQMELSGDKGILYQALTSCKATTSAPWNGLRHCALFLGYL